MRPAEFWSSTLPEISVYLEGTREAQRDALDMMKASAWWTAALSGQEKLPRLQDLISREPAKRKDKPQSLDSIMDEWKTFFARNHADVEIKAPS